MWHRLIALKFIPDSPSSPSCHRWQCMLISRQICRQKAVGIRVIAASVYILLLVKEIYVLHNVSVGVLEEDNETMFDIVLN